MRFRSVRTTDPKPLPCLPGWGLATLLVGLPMLAGCGATTGSVSTPSPAEIPALEAAAATRPGDGDVLVRLGGAYLEAGRGGEALPILRRAVDLRPDDPAGRILLAMAHESQGDLEEAMALYERTLIEGMAEGFAPQIRQRLALLRRRALETEIRQAAAREAEMATTPPREGTVAVLPLQFGSGDPEYRPLTRAMAELLVTGLSQVEGLTVLERLRVQLLLDELELTEAGLADPATAARSGRILGAARVVQGRLDLPEGDLEVLAAVVPVGPEVPSWPPPVEERDALPRLFELQERLVVALLSSMGIELSPADRDRVILMPTRNLDALLAWGRALEAEDRGAYAEAALRYREAAALDPAFQPASEGAERTESMVMFDPPAPPGPGATQGVTGIPGPLRDAGREWGITAGSGTFGVPTGISTPFIRDPAAELLGQESPGSASAILEILLRIPGG
jgi:tetratricopeptide (TPR) repeat protein